MTTDGFMEIFLEEAHELLQEAGSIAIEFERNPSDASIVNKLFRVAHTIKGSSASMGFSAMSELTHKLEDLLDAFRNGGFALDKASANLIFEALDALSEMLGSIESYGTDERVDISEIDSRITEWFRAGSASAGKPAENSSAAAQSAVSLLDARRISELEKRAGSENIFVIKIYLDEGDIKSARCFLVVEMLENHGDVIFAHPDIDDEALDDSDSIELIYSTAVDKDRVLEIVGMAGAERAEAAVFTMDMAPRSSAKENRPAAVKVESETSEKDVATGAETRERSAKTLRVEVGKLDDIMDLFGELVVSRTLLKNSLKGIGEIEELLNGAKGSDEPLARLKAMRADFQNRVRHADRISAALQEKVMKIRMAPVELVFSRFHRMTRELSERFGLEVNLEIEGKETELDKSLIEAIGDPLTHIVRNCFAHAIETPDEREAAGKSRAGTIRLSARYEGNSAVIEVSDDGRGMSPEKIKAAAVSKGIVTAEQASRMDNEAALDLIFAPSLSTAEEVDDVSGRGVGMDVVAKTLEKLNAMIEIKSEENEGSSFSMIFPLSLSIIQALMVETGGRVFALPMSNIREAVSARPGDIRIIDGKEFLMLRGASLPLTRLDALLGINGRAARKKIYVAIVGWGHRKMGLVVDALAGRQELFVKPLDEFFEDSNLIDGAAVMEDGAVALILNPRSIALNLALQVKNP